MFERTVFYKIESLNCSQRHKLKSLFLSGRNIAQEKIAIHSPIKKKMANHISR